MLVAYCETYQPTVIVCGDAEGPDDWASTWAATRSRDLRIYGLDGTVSDGGRVLRRWIPARTPGYRFNPLLRNTTMVVETATQRKRGAHAEVIAIEAGWSTSHGTAHTVTNAERAGLAVTRIMITCA